MRGHCQSQSLLCPLLLAVATHCKSLCHGESPHRACACSLCSVLTTFQGICVAPAPGREHSKERRDEWGSAPVHCPLTLTAAKPHSCPLGWMLSQPTDWDTEVAPKLRCEVKPQTQGWDGGAATSPSSSVQCGLAYVRQGCPCPGVDQVVGTPSLPPPPSREAPLPSL